MHIPPKLTSAEAVAIIKNDTPKAIEKLNTLAHKSFRTRGGRSGSGMGGLLEALWVYFINEALLNEGDVRGCEIAWFKDHGPNDFACVHRDEEWIPGSKEGELFRVEAKSMNMKDVKEPKAHFTELEDQIGDHDQLLVLAWQWKPVDEWRFYPEVIDSIVCPSKPIAVLRDALHKKRGGDFVPDTGEPINAKGVRERVKGPDSAKGEKVSAATNFGSLVRMLRTQKEGAPAEFRRLRKQNQTAHDFINFIHNNLHNEEANQYKANEWRQIALAGGINKATLRGLNKERLIELVRTDVPNYRDLLRDIP